MKAVCVEYSVGAAVAGLVAMAPEQNEPNGSNDWYEVVVHWRSCVAVEISVFEQMWLESVLVLLSSS